MEYDILVKEPQGIAEMIQHYWIGSLFIAWAFFSFYNTVRHKIKEFKRRQDNEPQRSAAIAYADQAAQDRFAEGSFDDPLPPPTSDLPEAEDRPAAVSAEEQLRQELRALADPSVPGNQGSASMEEPHADFDDIADHGSVEAYFEQYASLPPIEPVRG